MKSPILKNLLASFIASLVLIAAIMVSGTLAYHLLPPMPFHRLPYGTMAGICFGATFCSLLSYRLFRASPWVMAIYLLFVLAFFTGITLGNAFLTYRGISLADMIDFICKGGASLAGGILAMLLLSRKADTA